MGFSDFKKELRTYDKDKIIDIISDLYKKYKPVKEYLDFYLIPDEKKALSEYKDKILYAFYPKRGFNFKLKDAKKAITDFKKLSPSADTLADLMIFYVECGVNFTNDFGDIDGPFYTSLENTFVQALVILRDNDILDKFEERAKKVAWDSDGIGWGFGDYMLEAYYDFYPDDIEEDS
jgi:hypothetical protein